MQRLGTEAGEEGGGPGVGGGGPQLWEGPGAGQGPGRSGLGAKRNRRREEGKVKKKGEGEEIGGEFWKIELKSKCPVHCIYTANIYIYNLENTLLVPPSNTHS